MSKHSKLPWRNNHTYIDTDLPYDDPNYRCVACDLFEGDAALIVEAVNKLYKDKYGDRAGW